MTRETPCRLGRVGEEGSEAKMSRVQTVPTTLPWTLAPTVRARAQVTAHLSASACSTPSTTAQREGMGSHRGAQATHVPSLVGMRHLARQFYKHPAQEDPGGGRSGPGTDYTCLGMGEFPRTDITGRPARLPTPSCTSSTHLAHPRLAFAHGLSPLHRLP